MSYGVARITLRVIGFIAMLMALGGLLYTANTAYVLIGLDGLDVMAMNEDTPYVETAFYLMASTCAVFYLTLLFFGIRFLLLRTELLWLFTTLVIVEVVYFFAIGLLWPHPTYGLSIVAATGVANGGLMLQFVPLFPLWAPILVYFAKRSQLRNEQTVPV